MYFGFDRCSGARCRCYFERVGQICSVAVKKAMLREWIQHAVLAHQKIRCQSVFRKIFTLCVSVYHMDCPDCGTETHSKVVEKGDTKQVNRICPKCGKEINGGKKNWDNITDSLRNN